MNSEFVSDGPISLNGINIPNVPAISIGLEAFIVFELVKEESSHFENFKGHQESSEEV